MLGGVLVKDYYLDLVDGIADAEDLGKDNNESDIEGFEQDLQSLLQVFSTILLPFFFPPEVSVVLIPQIFFTVLFTFILPDSDPCIHKEVRAKLSV